MKRILIELKNLDSKKNLMNGVKPIKERKSIHKWVIIVQLLILNFNYVNFYNRRMPTAFYRRRRVWMCCYKLISHLKKRTSKGECRKSRRKEHELNGLYRFMVRFYTHQSEKYNFCALIRSIAM